MRARTPEQELVYPGPLKAGEIGRGTNMLQELLTYAGYPTEVDGIFGEETEDNLASFRRLTLKSASLLDPLSLGDWNALTSEICEVLRPFEPGPNFNTTVTRYAQLAMVRGACELRHFDSRAKANSGWWVRFFSGGYDGPERKWCADFATWCMERAARTHRLVEAPLPRTPSCDELAWAAKRKSLLFEDPASVKPGDLYLLKRERGSASRDLDYYHVGVIVNVFKRGTFTVISGNSNAAGAHEGTQVSVSQLSKAWGAAHYVRM